MYEKSNKGCAQPNAQEFDTVVQIQMESGTLCNCITDSHYCMLISTSFWCSTLNVYVVTQEQH